MRLRAHEIMAPEVVRTSRLRGRLCLDKNRYEVAEVGWVDVADGDDAEIWCSGGVDSEACSGGG